MIIAQPEKNRIKSVSTESKHRSTPNFVNIHKDLNCFRETLTENNSRMIQAGKQVCPCCSTSLIRCAQLGRIYWWCSQCYQAMPIL